MATKTKTATIIETKNNVPSDAVVKSFSNGHAFAKTIIDGGASVVNGADEGVSCISAFFAGISFAAKEAWGSNDKPASPKTKTKTKADAEKKLAEAMALYKRAHAL